MKIGLLSTYDSYGAGCAAARLHAGLKSIGEESFFIVKHKMQSSTDAAVIQAPEVNNIFFENLSEKHFINNIYEGNTICSIMYPSIGFDFLSCIDRCDIVNLHWITHFISLEAIMKINHMGKPIVWTLHDQNPMTGGCHYTHGCEKYKVDCSNCPQLRDNPYNITSILLQAKEKYLPEQVVIVTPSQWLADCARDSKILKKHRIEVIPNSLDMQKFKPIDMNVARSSLKLPASRKIILFGATSLKERRKGFALLLRAMEHFHQDPELKALLAAQQIHILAFGEESPYLAQIGVPYTSLGYVNSEEILAAAYSAADVLALPSIEDNLPNIMLESIACGTPVVAFQVGGMPDVIVNGKNGYLVTVDDTRQFAYRIRDLLFDDSLKSYCRKTAVEQFALSTQAEKYRALYQDIANTIKTSTKAFEWPPVLPEIANHLLPWMIESAKDLGEEYACINEVEYSVDTHLLLLLDRKVLIWGTGGMAQSFYEILCQSGDLQGKLVGFVDNQAEKWNTSFHAYPIYSPDQLGHMEDVVVLIGSMFHREIGQQLKSIGFIKCSSLIYFQSSKAMKG